MKSNVCNLDKHLNYNMPKNMGGKRYKKGKKGGGEQINIKMIEIDSADGQMIGRVLRVLGNRRFLVHGNDNIVRNCRLCGSLRKSDWVSVGSIVLFAKRDLNAAPLIKKEETSKGNEEDKAKSSMNNAAAFAPVEKEDEEEEEEEEEEDEEEEDEEINFEKEEDTGKKNNKNIGDILQVVDPSLYTKLSKLPGVNPMLFTDIENSFMKTNKVVSGSNEAGYIVFDDSVEEPNAEDVSDKDASLTDEQREAAAEAAVKAEKLAERKKKQEEFTSDGLKDKQKEAAKKRGSEREKKIKLSDL
jgi:translation initiation factor IF-1